MNRFIIRSIMSTELVTVESDHSFNLAEGIMRMERIRHLPVVEKGRRLVGLVTHWDIAQAQASFLARPLGDDLAEELKVPIAKIMQTRVRTVSPDTPVVEAARIMVEQKYGCLPVVESDHHLIGIVTESDFLDLLIQIIERNESDQGA
jgi:CBS domain-containing membrane protein